MYSQRACGYVREQHDTKRSWSIVGRIDGLNHLGLLNTRKRKADPLLAWEERRV
jgi:hypothetical protein